MGYFSKSKIKKNISKYICNNCIYCNKTKQTAFWQCIDEECEKYHHAGYVNNHFEWFNRHMIKENGSLEIIDLFNLKYCNNVECTRICEKHENTCFMHENNNNNNINNNNNGRVDDIKVNVNDSQYTCKDGSKFDLNQLNYVIVTVINISNQKLKKSNSKSNSIRYHDPDLANDNKNEIKNKKFYKKEE